MASEAKRGLLRIGSNYVRLFSGFIVGLVLVPLQISWYGMEAFGLMSLVLGAVGLSAALSEMMRNSMVREMGTAYHSGDERRFLGVYNSALGLSALVVVVTGVLLGLLGLWLVGGLGVSGSLRRAAVLMLAAEGGTWLVMIALAPINNQYALRERFLEENLWTIVYRSNYLIAALFVRYGLGVVEPVRALELFVVLSPMLGVAVQSLMAGRMVASDRRLVPRPGLMNRGDSRRVLGGFAFNGMTTLGYLSFETLPRFVTSAFQGVWVNGVFALAFNFVSYTRTMSLGMNGGLDAVSARVSSGRSTMSLASLCRHATRLHAFSVMPCVVLLVVLMGPLLELWVGRRVTPRAVAMPLAVSLAWILLPQVAIRSITDAWVRLLYGAGYVRRYAWMMMVGGLLNVGVTWVGYTMLREPSPIGVGGVVPTGSLGVAVMAWGYDWWGVRWQALVLTGVYGVLQLGVFPWVTGRCLGLSAWQVVRPIGRPAAAAVLASPALLLSWVGGAWWLLASVGAYGLVYAVCAWWIVLTGDERARIEGALRRRVGPRVGWEAVSVPAEVSAAQRELRLEADEVVNP